MLVELARVERLLNEARLNKVRMLGVYVGQLDLDKILDHLIRDWQAFAQQRRHHVDYFLMQFGKA